VVGGGADAVVAPNGDVLPVVWEEGAIARGWIFGRDGLVGLSLGFFLTPTQLIRNFVAMFSGSNSEQPSEKMVELVRARLSAQLVVEERNAQASRALRLAG